MSNTTASAAPVTTIRTFINPDDQGKLMKMGWNPLRGLLIISLEFGFDAEVISRTEQPSVRCARQSWNDYQSRLLADGWKVRSTYTVTAR